MSDLAGGHGGSDRATPVLVTGAAGFAGRHLLEHLIALGERALHALVRPDNDCEGLPTGVTLHSLDLQDRESVERLLGRLQPRRIYHLAALASAGAARRDPLGTLINNIAAQVNLLEATRSQSFESRTLIVSSGDVYGIVEPAALPIDERCELRPLNHYSVSKATQDLLGYQYWRAYGMQVVRVRPFNHSGPGQDPRFVIPDFARQIARIETGLQQAPLQVGNLSAERDFSDVRDIVRGYRLAIEQGMPGEVYNLGSGRATRVGAVLERLLDLSGQKIAVEVDQSRLRAGDAPPQYCSYARLERQTGWQPRIPLDQTLADTLAWWRKRVATLGELA
jgi:GDP-4-dehydro-6-deoxy-D-mannose reductase